MLFYFSLPEPLFLSYLLSSSYDLYSLPAAWDSRFIARLVFSFENSAAEHSLLLVHVRGLITLLLILDMHKIEAWPSFNPPSAIDGGCPLINIKDLQCTLGSWIYFGFAVTVTVDPHLVKKKKKEKEIALLFVREPIYLCSPSTSFNMGLVMIKATRFCLLLNLHVHSFSPKWWIPLEEWESHTHKIIAGKNIETYLSKTHSDFHPTWLCLNYQLSWNVYTEQWQFRE